MSRFLAVIAVVVLVAIVALRLAQRRNIGPVATIGPEEAMGVEVIAAGLATIEERIDLGGTIEPGSEVVVTSKIPGRVVKVLASVGRKVAAGESLAEIDSAEFAALRAACTQAEIGLADARLAFQRLDSLYKQQAISRQQWEAALNAVNLAEANYQAAREHLRQAGGLAGGPNGERMILAAPQAGTVASENLDPGNLIAPGVPLVTIVDIGTVYARVGIPEHAVNKVSPGSTVDVRVESIGLTRKGRIDSVGPAPDPRTRAYPVTVVLDNPSEDVKPGMFAHILLSLGKRENALVVPRDSVVERAGKRVVYIVKPGDPVKAEERVVALGLENGQMVEVLSGVSLGEQVVTNGQHLLVDGALVKVKTAAEQGAAEQGTGEGGGKPQ